MSGTYSLFDFTETVDGRRNIARVVAAWGESSEGWGQWSGGFLMELTDGRDTGWGCQDGRDTEHFDTEPDLSILTETAGLRAGGKEWSAPVVDWDHEPVDLNRWLAAGSPDTDTFKAVTYEPEPGS